MRIRELADLGGVTPETIRWYERIGLLEAPAREANNYRSYGPRHLETLEFIRHCRGLDLGIEEIRELLNARRLGTCEEADRAHALIHGHLEEVDRRIAELEALRGQLSDLASRCGGHHEEGRPCAILEELSEGETALSKAAASSAEAPL